MIHSSIFYTYVIPPILGFLIMSTLGLISILRGKKNPTNILFAGICFLGATINADVAIVFIIPDKSLALQIDRLTYFFFVFSLPIYIQFVHYFLGISRRKWLEYMAYCCGVIFVFFVPTDLFISGFYHYNFWIIAKAGPIFHVFSVIAASTVFYCLITLLIHMKEAQDNQRKNRIKYVLGGMGLSSLLIALNLLPVSGFNIYPMGNFSFLPSIILAFGVLKFDLLDIGVIIRRGTIYFFLTGILTFIYIFIIYLFNVFFMGANFNESVFLPFTLALLIVLIFNPTKEKVQIFIDKLFFRGKYDYQKILLKISGEMASLLKFQQIESLLVQELSEALQVYHVHLWVKDDEGKLNCSSVARDGCVNTTEQNVIWKNHPMIAYFEENKEPLTKSEVNKKIKDYEKRNRMLELFNDMNAVLIIPMISDQQLIGMITLGQKKSGELFVDEDIELLTTIANQSATAIKNARSYEEIENLNLDLEKKVEKRTADLRQALMEKERTQQQLVQSESLAAIGQLVAGTAHELNNPMATASSLVQTSLEAVSQWESPEMERDEILADLSFSLKELRRASDIIRSLLDLSRQTHVYIEPVNLNIAIDHALRILHNYYKDIDLEIEKQFDETLPTIEGNFANLGQIMINIIKNAIQSLNGESGRIILKTYYKPQNNCVYFECIDSGMGIPGDQIKDIFKPFFTTQPVGKGTGLGLYISHEIAKKHGGNIHVTSEYSKGSTFTLELPYRRGGEK
jgi:two-component system NtrC family sensor kinase